MVIDTCIFIEHLRAKNRLITTLANLSKNQTVYFSVITLFELYCGAPTPDKKKDIITVTEDLNLLPFDDTVALKASDVYRTLKQQNKQIGLSDILIAATCLVYDQPILTSNKKHFQLVDGLKIAV